MQKFNALSPVKQQNPMCDLGYIYIVCFAAVHCNKPGKRDWQQLLLLPSAHVGVWKLTWTPGTTRMHLQSRKVFSLSACEGSHLPVQTHKMKQTQTHHDLMSLFLSAVKMLTVISYGDYISHFSCSGPQNHWMVLPVSRRRKQKSQGTIEGYCFMFVY